MNDIMFTILQAILSLSIILIMRYVLPYLKVKLQSVCDAYLFNAIRDAVKSVEQTIVGEKMGQAKKEEVEWRIVKWANAHKIAITQEQLSDLIETAVWTMNNEDKKNG